MSCEERDKAFRIMEALSSVDEALLDRSEKPVKAKKRIPVWRYGKMLAACFAFVMLGACALGAYIVVTWRAGSSDQSAMESPSYAMNYNRAGEAAEAEGVPDENVPEEGSGQSTDGPARESILTEQKLQSEKEEQHQDSGSRQSGSTVDMSQNPEKSQIEVLNGVTEDDTPGLEVCQLDSRKELTWEEAREMVIGAYLPTDIPEGYQLESIRGMAEAASYNEMTVFWVKGMDDICLHITDYYAIAKPPEGSDLILADISKPETYNVHLYEIPYGETVPEEYRQIFFNPVFRAGDLTPELVEERMKAVEDSGDTDTPRGRFGVLYDSGVLVEFNGDAAPEEVWEMFVSIRP